MYKLNPFKLFLPILLAGLTAFPAFGQNEEHTDMECGETTTIHYSDVPYETATGHFEDSTYSTRQEAEDALEAYIMANMGSWDQFNYQNNTFRCGPCKPPHHTGCNASFGGWNYALWQGTWYSTAPVKKSGSNYVVYERHFSFKITCAECEIPTTVVDSNWWNDGQGGDDPGDPTTVVIKCNKKKTIYFELSGICINAPTKDSALSLLAGDIMANNLAYGFKCEDCEVPGECNPEFVKFSSPPNLSETSSGSGRWCAPPKRISFQIKCTVCPKAQNNCDGAQKTVMLNYIPPFTHPFDPMNPTDPSAAYAAWYAMIADDNGSEILGNMEWGCDGCLQYPGACSVQIDQNMSSAEPPAVLVGDTWHIQDAANWMLVYSCSFCAPSKNSTSIDEASFNEELIENLFPSPANDVIYLEVAPSMKEHVVRVSILNASGQEVQKELGTPNRGNKDQLIYEVDQLSEGHYFIRIDFDNQEYAVRKFAIKR